MMFSKLGDLELVMDDNLVLTHGVSNDLSLDAWILVSDLTVESVFCRFGANGTDRSMNSDRCSLKRCGA